MHRTAQRGFTLIELVTVVVLLGVLSVVIAPRAFNNQVFNARGLHDETLAFVRYAHKTAIAQRRTVCLAFTGTSVALAIAPLPASSDCTATLTGPTGQSPALLTARSGAAYDVQPPDFGFNGLGQPVDVLGTPMPTQTTLQVAGMALSIVVEPVTGYVHE